jgi:hypothetical protein
VLSVEGGVEGSALALGSGVGSVLELGSVVDVGSVVVSDVGSDVGSVPDTPSSAAAWKVSGLATSITDTAAATSG